MSASNLRFVAFAAAAVLLVTRQPAPAATLVLDEQFQTPEFTHETVPWRMLSLPDGKFLRYFAAATLTTDTSAGPITRYLADGTLDTSFQFSRDYQDVSTVTSLPDGKLLVAARQHSYGVLTGVERILRLEANGTIDPTFDAPVVGFGSARLVRRIVIAPDGRIVVAGGFESFAGTPRQFVARLHADGAIDESFNPPAFLAAGAFRGSVWTATTTADGKVIVAGDFVRISGVASDPRGIARFNLDGSVDTSFLPSGFSRVAATRQLIVQSDGKVVMAGGYNIGNSSPRYALLRLNLDGSRDTTFNPAGYGFTPTTRDMALAPDGRFVAAMGSTVLRYNTDGSADTTFASVAAYSGRTNGAVYSVAVEPGGTVIFSGLFDSVGQRLPGYPGIGRAAANGTPQTIALSHRPADRAAVTSALWHSDGTAFATFGAAFKPLTPQVPYAFARLMADGSVSPTPALSSSDPGSVLDASFTAGHITRAADGSLYVSGARYSPQHEMLIDAGGRFSDTGTELRNSGAAYEAESVSLTAEPAGTLLRAAEAHPQATLTWNGPVHRLRRTGYLSSDFALDPQVANAQIVRDPNTNILFALYPGSRVLAVQPDGKIIFTYFSRDLVWHLVRLQPNGTIDPTFTRTTVEAINVTRSSPVLFDPLTGINGAPVGGSSTATVPFVDAEVLPDGRMIVAGWFTTFRGIPAAGLVRLQADGTVDSTFQIGAGAQWTQTTPRNGFFPAVEQVERQTDGKLLIAGTFEAFNGLPLPGIASLQPDGALDSSFQPAVRRVKNSGAAAKLQRQPDGSFLLMGPYAFPNSNHEQLIHIRSVGGVPVVGSPRLATALLGQSFTYKIVASGEPATFGANGLPAGFSFDPASGTISGTATTNNIGVHTVAVTATNGEGTSMPHAVLITVPPLPAFVSAESIKAHGAAGEFPLGLPLTGAPGVEPRGGSQHEIMLTANNEILSGTIDLGPTPPSSNSWSFENKFQIQLSLFDDARRVTITWDSVVDEYGQAMPDSSVTVGFLHGDANGDGVVNAADALQTRSRSGQDVNAGNARSDFNRDGFINSGDALIVRSRSGNSLP